MEVVKVEAQVRENFGKKYNNALRKQGLVPAIIYGGDSNVAISLKPSEVKPLIYTPDFKLAEIHAGGETHKCIIKDSTFHPVTDELVHLDFLRLRDGIPIKLEIPVSYKGKSPGVKAGGKLITTMRKVKVKTIPSKIVDTLYVNIDGLELGESVRVKDIELPEGMEIMTDTATPVAMIEIPRALKSAAAAEAKEANEND